MPLKIKQGLIIILLLHLCHKANAIDTEPKIGFYLGASAYNFNNKMLRKSINSYIDYYSSNNPGLKVKGLKTGTEKCWSLFMTTSKGLIFELNHAYFQSDAQIEFSDGTRSFKSIFKGSTFFVGKKYKKNIFWKVGFGNRRSVLECSYVYPDGTRSFGKEKALNGVYEAPLNSWNWAFELGKQFIIQKHLVIETSIGFSHWGRTMAYRDPSYARTMNQSVNYEEIPTDYNAFYKAVSNYDVYPDKDFVRPKSYNAYINLKVGYMINLKK